VDVLAFLVGALVVLWPVTLTCGTYAFWRYVLCPWRSMRKDLTALRDQLGEHIAWTKGELGLRRAMDARTETEGEARARLHALASRLTLKPPPPGA
jgi:hypothetical protein